MKIMLMGPPASGKGTVGTLLSKDLNLPIVSSGQLLRDVPENSPNYKIIHDYMDKGVLVPADIVANLLKEEVGKEEYEDGYLLDGWMRDMEQKNFFDPGFDKVIFIKISNETILKRISGRRFCPKDNFSCNIYTLPPNDPNHCDNCSGELEQRDDDKEEVVKERINLYENDTKPVIDYYREQGILIEVDGEGTPEEVLALILKELNNDSN